MSACGGWACRDAHGGIGYTGNLRTRRGKERREFSITSTIESVSLADHVAQFESLGVRQRPWAIGVSRPVDHI